MIEQQIKYRHLQCFLEVVSQQSVVRAAEKLCVTQPAISKTLKELEDALGVRLLERSRRGVALTEHGEIFYRYAGASISALRQGISSVRGNIDRVAEVLRVGVLPTAAARLMPLAVNQLKLQAPGVVVHLATGTNAQLLAQLKRGELDLVVGRLLEPDLMAGLSFEHLYSENLLVVVRPSHPLATADRFDISQIAQYPVLLPTDETFIRKEIDRFLISHGLAPLPNVVETISIIFARSHALQFDSVWFIGYGVVSLDLAEGTLIELPTKEGEMHGPVGVTINVDLELSPLAQMMCNVLRRVSETVAPR